MNADLDGRLTAARERVARLERELAAARAAVRALESDPAISPVPGTGVTAASSTAEKIALFRSRFVGRTDAFALPWTSRKTGKSGWSPAVRGGFYSDQSSEADLLTLDDAVIERHLRGGSEFGREFHVGLYPMLPGDRCQLLVCDFDDGNWQGDAAAYVDACRQAGVDTLAEISRSGAGAHVWIFFEATVAASAARALGAHLLRSAMSISPSMTMSSYDRFFPAQDTLPQRSPAKFRLGNLIALPLQGERRRRQTTVFADPRTWQPCADQFAVLAAVNPVSVDALAELASTTTVLRVGPSDVVPPPRRPTRRPRPVGAVPIEIRRDAMVHVPLAGLPGSVISELKHLASVSNPEFYRKQAQRLSTFGTPRLVICFEHDVNELRLPRGLLDQTVNVLVESGFRPSTRVLTDKPAEIDVTFTGELREPQQRAVDALLGHDTGVLVASPGAGKTVMACALIAERATPTAILVNRAELLQQWRDRLTQFLSLTDKQLGQLGSGRRKRRGLVDLIMMQSVSHRTGDPAVLEEYGQIIVDECHAVAAPSTEAAIRTVNARYWVGLTATPFRADQMDGLITMQCGPIRHTIKDVERADRSLIVHETSFTTEEPGIDGPSIQAIYSELAVDEPRNALIADEIVRAAVAGRTCLVLTNRVDHLRALVAALEPRCDVPVLSLHGQLAPPERRAVRGRLVDADRAGDPFVLVAIDKVAGEGLDLPSLNTLFLTMPVSFRGRVIQQIGRVTRTGSARPAEVHDFRDSQVPLLERMFGRRRRVMAKQGFRPAQAQP
jgi:superfamily II DNA or RNA helicase